MKISFLRLSHLQIGVRRNNIFYHAVFEWISYYKDKYKDEPLYKFIIFEQDLSANIAS